jgi:fumarate hydratase class I
LIVARDIAHAKIKELLDAGKPMPDYFKTIQFIMLVPKRECLQEVLDQLLPVVWIVENSKTWGSMIMLAKGNRTAQVTMHVKPTVDFIEIYWWSCCDFSAR